MSLMESDLYHFYQEEFKTTVIGVTVVQRTKTLSSLGKWVAGGFDEGIESVIFVA